MIVPPAVQQRFNRAEPHLETLRVLVGATIEPWAEQHGFGYESRIKRLDSVAEKIETGRFAGWADLDDLLACAIVVPTHSREQAALDFLDARFVTEGVRRRGEVAKPPDAFRFDSTRWRGRLPAHPEGIRPDVDALLFEVQIRSAFEHAWNLTTHDLAFKGQMIDWRRVRLVAQIKAAVEQIDMLIDGFDDGMELVREFPWKEFEQQAALRAEFVRKLDAGLIDRSLAPKDWTRFAQNLLALIFASAPSRRNRDDHFQACLAQLHASNDDLPLSCSLLQSALGILSEANLVRRLETGYSPLVTPELEYFFPSTIALSDRFDLS